MPYADDTRADDLRADDDRAPRRVRPTRAMRFALQMAFRTALIRLATDLGIVFLIAVVAALAGNYPFIALAIVLGLLIGTPGLAAQSARLRRSLDAPGIVRQFCPISVTEHRRNGVSSFATFHWAVLADGTRLHLDESSYRRLSEAGERQPDARPLWQRLFGGRSVFQLPTVVTTYSTTGRLLLEVRTPAGEVVARHAGYTGDE